MCFLSSCISWCEPGKAPGPSNMFFSASAASAGGEQQSAKDTNMLDWRTTGCSRMSSTHNMTQPRIHCFYYVHCFLFSLLVILVKGRSIRQNEANGKSMSILKFAWSLAQLLDALWDGRQLASMSGSSRPGGAGWVPHVHPVRMCASTSHWGFKLCTKTMR